MVATETHDWRGIHPYPGYLRRWVVAQTLSASADGLLRARYHCWTKAGALRAVERLNQREAHREQYQREALITAPYQRRFELVGHITDHPGRA